MEGGGVHLYENHVIILLKKSVFTLGNLLTPDIWKKGVISIFKQNNKQNNQQKLQNSNQEKAQIATKYKVKFLIFLLKIWLNYIQKFIYNFLLKLCF